MTVTREVAMTRRAHLWFICGVALTAAGLFAGWLTLVLSGQLWGTEWRWPLLIFDALLLLLLIRMYLAHRRARLGQDRPISQEMRCAPVDSARRFSPEEEEPLRRRRRRLRHEW